jgi:DNA-binding response OmpR family regulator
MTNPLELIDPCDPFTTVIVVKRSSEIPDPLVETLTDAGLNVVGPVDTAAQALAMIAQTRADVALVAAELAGRRDGFELARCLKDTWGVPAVMLSRA